MPDTARFRLALGGLVESDGATLRQWFADGELTAASQWDLVESGADALVIDPVAPDAAEQLASRRFGSLVVLALRPGEAAWPGTLTLSRPFDRRQVDLTLSMAAQIAAHTAFTLQAPPAAPAADIPPSPSEPADHDASGTTDDAPLFAQVIEEAADTVEAQARADEGEEPEPPVQTDAGNPFDAPVLQDDADDAAIDRLALAVLQDHPPSEDDAAEPEDTAPMEPMDEAIVDLSADDDLETAEALLDAEPAEQDDRPGPFDDLMDAPILPDDPFPSETEPAPVQAAPPPAPVAEEFPDPTVALDEVTTLAELATAYREQLYRERHVVVRIDGHTFHLEPYAGECFSSSPASVLEAYRGHGNLDVTISVEDAPASERPSATVRLVDFLWQLGYNAGAGRLLPWVEADARYRITRQPPMDEDAKATGVLQLSQLISRTPVAVADMAHLAGAPGRVVHDVLNGCSLLGYLERVAQPHRRRPETDPAPRRSAPNPSLIGSLRRRIGLEK